MQARSLEIAGLFMSISQLNAVRPAFLPSA